MNDATVYHVSSEQKSHHSVFGAMVLLFVFCIFSLFILRSNDASFNVDTHVSLCVHSCQTIQLGILYIYVCFPTVV